MKKIKLINQDGGTIRKINIEKDFECHIEN